MKLQWYCQNIEAVSGYSDEARVMVRGLENLGVDMTVVGSRSKGRPAGFQRSSTIDPAYPVVYHTYRHNSYHHTAQIHAAVRTMLEVSPIPQSWVYHFQRMTEVWVPNPFNFRTFSESGVPEKKLVIIPSPVELTDPKSISPYAVKSKKKFKFLSILDYQARDRKGLDILIQTYQKSFSRKDNVCLIIKGKTNLQQLIQEYAIDTDGPEIEVVNKILHRHELLGLHKTADCYILPSRGEGVGRPLLDAMMMGTPIITTGWSGPADYLNRDNAWLLDYRLVQVEPRHYLNNPGFYGSQWVEPVAEDLAIKMKQVIHHTQEARILARKARQDVSAFAQDKVCRLIQSRLQEGIKGDINKKNLILSIFEKLYPIYYPGVYKSREIQARSQLDFSQPVDSLILTGLGPALSRAVNFFSSCQSIQHIYFLDQGRDYPQAPAQLLQNKITFSKAAKTAPIVVIAASVPKISNLYHSILKRIDTLPLYVFM